MEEQAVPVPDAKTGTVKTVIEKVPVTKNKVIPKPAGSATTATVASTPAVIPAAAPVA